MWLPVWELLSVFLGTRSWRACRVVARKTGQAFAFVARTKSLHDVSDLAKRKHPLQSLLFEFKHGLDGIVTIFSFFRKWWPRFIASTFVSAVTDSLRHVCMYGSYLQVPYRPPMSGETGRLKKMKKYFDLRSAEYRNEKHQGNES